ncbi:MAG TPA: glycosyltransferase family 4 protein [Micromonosporaceae bacterium]|nr:glycosyltransferase family 4 protein [Micromonosporaceae bacterium]
MVVPPFYGLPPPGYGGLEQVCAALIDALAARGNEVTLFGAGNQTRTRARLVSTGDLQHQRLGQTLPELAHLSRVDHLLREGSYDVVHDHTTAGPILAGRRPLPTVVTVHGKPVGDLGEILGAVNGAAGLVAISEAQRRLNPGLPWTATIHHGLPLDELPARPKKGDGPVLWLARFTPDKGPDLAIQACRAAGLPLVLAGKCNERNEQRYLTEAVEPMLGPDVTVEVNPVRERTMELVGSARCLILPIRWEEPFGMVMLEAMASGTPVVALNRGAAPELVLSGETGIVCDEPAELPDALREVSTIDPEACVERVRRSFSADVMARRYEDVYRLWIASQPQPAARELTPSGAW